MLRVNNQNIPIGTLERRPKEISVTVFFFLNKHNFEKTFAAVETTTWPFLMH